MNSSIDIESRHSSRMAATSHASPREGALKDFTSINHGPWVILLAGGHGTRLRPLTTTREGVAVPTQFCSLCGGPSLLEETLERAATLTEHARICAVVAEEHRRWWVPQLSTLLASNIIVQPTNRGTAHGILLPLLEILKRDPDANVVLLPCDHFVSDERVLAGALRHALLYVTVRQELPVLLGMPAQYPDSELGYIVPDQTNRTGVSQVVRFHERPTLSQARELIQEGALWSSFIVVSNGRALSRIFEGRMGDLVEEMLKVRNQALRSGDQKALSELYARLAMMDFARDVLQPQTQPLCVFRVPECGWSDLGTPHRLAATLSRMPADLRMTLSYPTTSHLNLALEQAAIQTSAVSS